MGRRSCCSGNGRRIRPPTRLDPRPPFISQTPVQSYTATLDPNLPPTTYHVYTSSKLAPLEVGRWFYLKAKDTLDSQTLYVLQELKRSRYQIPSMAFHRSAEFASPRRRNRHHTHKRPAATNSRIRQVGASSR
jgi:hypothetical protein